MMKGFIILLGTSAVVLSTLGCSNPFGGSQSVVDPNHHPGVVDNTVLTPAQNFELVSASSQYTTTSSGQFKINGAMGGLSHQVDSVTTRGYHVFSNVQGEIISNGNGL